MAENFERGAVFLTTTSETDVYQAPNGSAEDRAILLGCLVANVTNGIPANISIAITDSLNNLISYTAYSVVVPPRSTLECLPSRVVLKRGEKIRATASGTSQLECTVSALELTP